MDRDLLEGYLEEGLSLERIAKRAERHPSTVGYWIQKHGLCANGRSKHIACGDVAREQLEPFVERGATLREIAEELDRSASTVRYWLRRYGLKTKGYGYRRKMAREARRRGNSRFTSICERHGETDFFALPDGRSRCGKCSSAAVSRRRQKVKRLLIAEAGGGCELCGYNGCAGALQFHHRDPQEKLFGVSERGFTRSIAELRTEVRKCVLLCANCHAEVEGGAAELPVK